MSLFIVPAMFTVVNDFQWWLVRFGGRGAEDEGPTTPAPSAIG
jgi:hypothetical protein